MFLFIFELFVFLCLSFAALRVSLCAWFHILCSNNFLFWLRIAWLKKKKKIYIHSLYYFSLFIVYNFLGKCFHEKHVDWLLSYFNFQIEQCKRTCSIDRSSQIFRIRKLFAIMWKLKITIVLVFSAASYIPSKNIPGLIKVKILYVIFVLTELQFL